MSRISAYRATELYLEAMRFEMEKYQARKEGVVEDVPETKEPRKMPGRVPKEIEDLVDLAFDKRVRKECWRLHVNGKCDQFVSLIEKRINEQETVPSWKTVHEILRERFGMDIRAVQTVSNHFQGKCSCDFMAKVRGG